MGTLFNPACHSCSCVGTLRTFVGGQFTSVGGTSRLSLAKLNGDGTLDAGWSADLSDSGGNPTIKAMVLDGSTLYVGGNFDTIGGEARECLAALDVQTGVVQSWTADISTGGSDNVDSLLLLGTSLYVGGSFTSIDGTARDNAAVVDTGTGAVGSWNPDTNGAVLCLAHDSGIIYLGGSFTTVSGGTARNRAAAFATDGTLQSWNPNVSTAGSSVRSMAIDNSIVYLAGNFSTVAGSTRRGVAAYSVAGALQSWDPDIRNAGLNPGNCRTIAIASSIVYVGGNFRTLSAGTVSRNQIAAIGTDGTVQSWNPNVTPDAGTGSGFGVYRLFIEDGQVYCAGVCSAVGGVTRNDAFVISTTGTLADWNANLSGGTVTGESIIAAE
jgi:hypothetical protein